MNLLQDVIPNVFVSTNKTQCQVCPLAKQHSSSFTLSSIKTFKTFYLIHCDTWGPFTVSTTHGHHYFLTMLDDYTRTWVFLVKLKSETRMFLASFFYLVETKFASKIKILRSNNGLKFNMTSFFSNKGVIHQQNCTYTP